MASGFIEESSYETAVCPDCGHEIDWEQDAISGRTNYQDGDWIRIDVAFESEVPYTYHGHHGVIVNQSDDGYWVEIAKKDVAIKISERDLRIPYLPRGQRQQMPEPRSVTNY
jgi:voltage-gated potassium channel